MINKKKFFEAGLWVVVVFGLSQLLRLGSNLVLTRILEPQAFGVMAIVYVVIYGIAMFSDLGLWAFVVRHKNYDDTHLLNVVWTLQVIRGWIIYAVVLVFSAVLIFGNKFLPDLFSQVYANAELPYLLLIAGLTAVIAGYNSMASPVMSRKLEVRKLEVIELIASLVGTIVMLIWAWLSPTIWSLLSAGLVTGILGNIMRYYAYPFRHHFVWDKAIFKEVYDFSKWVLIASILTYLFSQADKLFFGAKISASELGVYSIAFMLCTTLTSVTQTLAEKVVFPVFSSFAQGDREKLKQKYYQVRLYSDLVIFLGCGLLIALGPAIVSLFYDSRYHDAGWMLQVLTLSVVGNTLSLMSMECLSALSITKVRMWVMLIRTIGLFIGLPLFFNLYGIYGAIWVVALNVWLSLPLVYWTLAKNQVFSLYSELKMLPVIALGYGAGMAILNFFSN